MHFLNDVGKKIISPNGLQRTSSLFRIRYVLRALSNHEILQSLEHRLLFL